MMDDYDERQENEVEFLQAVFPGDFQDLRLKDPWKIHRPPEFTLSLVPQKSMGGSVQDLRPLSIKLHAKYTTDYPDSKPELLLEDPQGITSDQVKELLDEINKVAEGMIGEEMMLEIAQHVQAFLHKHDRPPVSLHEEMVIRMKEKEREERQKMEAERQAYQKREEEERRRIEEEIKRKKAELLHSDNSEDSDEDSTVCVTEHSTAATSTSLTRHNQRTVPCSTSPLKLVTFPEEVLPARAGGEIATKMKQNKDLHINRGKSLGESLTGGYAVFVGMDDSSGDLLAVYEWSLHFKPARRGDSRRLKQVASIQQEFDSFQTKGIHHPNLVQYLAFNYSHRVRDNKIIVELVQEYVGGGSISSLLRNPDCGAVTGKTLCHYCKQLLEALKYLHSRGIVHNDIRPSLVFLDGGGGIKLGGFSIIKRLTDLHRSMNVHIKSTSASTSTSEEDVSLGVWPMGIAEVRGGKKGDILKFGMLILCMALGKMDINYPPTISDDLPDLLKDFLAKCVDENEQCRFPAHELLHHPFISSSPRNSPSSSPTTLITNKHLNPTNPGLSKFQSPMHFQRSDSIVGSPTLPYAQGRSRLESEFKELEVLGSGGFGDVIKVRNHLDGRPYALKKIRIRSDSKMMNRITREVELLSQMNHENVVRYYNAWIETYTEQEYKRHSGTNLSDQSDEEDSDPTEGEEDSQNQAEDVSIEFRNETSSSGSSDSSSESDFSDSESITFEEDEDSFVKFESSAIINKKKSSSLGVETIKEEADESKEYGEEVGVFMNDFSDSSGEGRNILGELETQVMNLALPRFRGSTTESSDTVVFMDSSVTASTKPLAIKRDRRRERKKQRTHGQVQFLYIQMEYCENETLRQLIDTKNLHSDEDKVWRLFREIVEGLEHIHSKGMIHRDLKPGNIFLNSSGHIKIGDFGLATSHKHPISKESSGLAAHANTSLLEDGNTGLVGTAMYLAPELFKPLVKYTQKVDIYSVGIIFFEMCHPPISTAMERHKLLIDLRKRDIIIPSSFDREKKRNQEKVILWLLNHNPHERPTSKQLLQSPLLPLKMEDEELQEVLLRTFQSTNSTRYRYLIDELFAQEGSRVSEFSYFVEPQDSKRRSLTPKNKFSFCHHLLQQLAHSRLVNIFTRHGASYLSSPLLSPRSGLYLGLESLAEFMDKSGSIVALPHDHRVPFARYVTHQDITYLKRYCISPVFRESRVQGSHPREQYECQFDIVSPTRESLIPEAEVMYVVSEIINEVPGLQENQFTVWINHTSLLSSILTHCSIPLDRHTEVGSLTHKIDSGTVKPSELERRLQEKGLRLSPLATKALQKFVCSAIPFDSRDIHSLLEPLLRDRSRDVGSKASLAWQEISTVVKYFRQFGGKENVYIHPGLAPSVNHFSGLIFQFMATSTAHHTTKKSKRTKRAPLAIGGRYDRLLGMFCRPGKQPSNVSVVGVTVMGEVVMNGVISAYIAGSCHVTKCPVLVCWLGRESLQQECISLVRDLWSQGISADILYDSMEMDTIEDVQEFCRSYFIPHIVVLNDKKLFFERKQVKVRTVESGKVVEKVMTTSELVDFLQQRQHSIERSDSTESREIVKTSSSSSTEGQSNAMPLVNVTILASSGKLSGHMKRKYHDQALTKLMPLLQNFSSKQPLEVLVVDMKTDLLSALAAELNKVTVKNNDTEFSSLVKTLCESYNESNKKYIVKVCETIHSLLKKKVPLIFIYSSSAEVCQTVLNSFESLTSTT